VPLKCMLQRKVKFRGVPNSGFRLFSRIRIVLLKLFGRIRIRIALAAEHFDAAPAVLIFTTSLNSYGCLYGRVCMLPSHDSLPFIRLIVSQNQVV